MTLSILQGLGLKLVEDLALINDEGVTVIFPAFHERDTLIDLWRDIVVEVSARSLRHSLDQVVEAAFAVCESTEESSPNSGHDSSNGSPSKGSVYHEIGDCKPCAWFHHKEGCHSGADCEFCHTCPFGELRRRKRERVQSVKTRDQNS